MFNKKSLRETFAAVSELCMCVFGKFFSFACSLFYSLSLFYVSLCYIYLVKKADILQLIQLVFTVLTVAMQDDPANKLFFETNVSNYCTSVCEDN